MNFDEIKLGIVKRFLRRRKFFFFPKAFPINQPQSSALWKCWSLFVKLIFIKGDRHFRSVSRFRDGWMVGWMDGWMDRWMDGWVDGWVDRWMDGWMDGWVGGWMDGWVDGWMDGWMSGWKDDCQDCFKNEWMG